MDKLTMYASLVGVVTAIGGGFYAWGEFNTRLSAIEGNNVDVSGISKNAEDIAVVNEKVDGLDLSQIAVLEEKIKKLESKSVDRSDTLTNRSLYIGFLGKILISMVYALLLVVIFPLLNGGEMLTFTDNLSLQFGAERTNLDRITFFLWTSSLAIMPLAISFEALMFVHASLKDSVFGIDKKLRATFRTAVFTSLGVISFVIGSEIMESLIGYGIIGGVMVGIGVVVVRKPVISLIDGLSGRILPSEFSEFENKYLEAYIKTVKDGIITVDERRLLIMLAHSYSLQDERVKYIEMSYNSSVDQEE